VGQASKRARFDHRRVPSAGPGATLGRRGQSSGVAHCSFPGEGNADPARRPCVPTAGGNRAGWARPPGARHNDARLGKGGRLPEERFANAADRERGMHSTGEVMASGKSVSEAYARVLW